MIFINFMILQNNVIELNRKHVSLNLKKTGYADSTAPLMEENGPCWPFFKLLQKVG